MWQSESLVAAIDQVTPTDVPEHLLAATVPAELIRPGACPRCGEVQSAPLMRSEHVEYLLCGECGRVWVERCARGPSAASPVRLPHHGIVTRVLAALAAAARFRIAQRA
jgi:ribosomal protein S27AE